MDASKEHGAIHGGLSLPPMSGLVVAFSIFTAAALTAMWLATAQPWLGLVMRAGDDGLVILWQVQRDDIPIRLEPGARISRIGAIDLKAQDLIEEPDTLGSYEAVNAFRVRQAALFNQLEQRTVSVSVSYGDDTRRDVAVVPYAGRPAWSLPFEFWLQLFVGGAGILLGAWVWTLKRDHASGFFALSGLGLMLSALSASVYSTRELALGGLELELLAAGNFLGTNIFGLGLVSLLLIYPHRIAAPWVIAGAWIGGLALVGAQLLQLMPSQAVSTYGPMLGQFILLFALLMTQLFWSRRSPLARAAVGWFGLSILLGTGVFVFAIAVPVLLGLEPQSSQAHAFGIILLIYCGLAIGVARYRLFDLGIWSFRLVSYLLGAFVLIGLDAVLIYVVAIERIPAFGLSLLGVAFLYLPLRNVLGRLLTRQSHTEPSRFREIVDIALARDGGQQQAQWRSLLEACFAPLTIEPTGAMAKVRLEDGGQQLLVPATAVTPPLVMRFAHGGRRLFSQADAGRLQELVDLMTHALASRDAQERGAREERSRMARDLHDNIGAQLLRTLHSADKDRKDAIIGETLTDLRDIINQAQGAGMKLSEILAELRFETDERLGAVEIDMGWHARFDQNRIVDARLAHTLRSIIREAASNAIRHAKANRFSVVLDEEDGALNLQLSDDGVGVSDFGDRQDGGLVNMAARAEGHGGSFRLSGTSGTTIEVCIPLKAGQQ